MVANREDRAAIAARVAEQRRLAGHTQESLALAGSAELRTTIAA
ncbi:hypothetical protein [Nocardia asteroides]